MPDTHLNRIRQAVVGAAGTGSVTLGAAATGFKALASAQNGQTFSVLFTDGDAWEIAVGCTYTHSGPTLTRGTLEDSSTGSRISLTSSANIAVILPASRGTAWDESSEDAREWTAATVDQAEAEAGTATTRRAWTAQRVAQAIAAQVTAWWAALTVGPSKITMSTARLLGRTTAGSGAAEEISIGSGLSLSAGTLSATGGALPAGITSPGDGALDFATGALTASRPSVNVTQTWNNGGVQFASDDAAITDTASAAQSTVIRRVVNGTTVFSVQKNGYVNINPTGTAGPYGFRVGDQCEFVTYGSAFGQQYLYCSAPAGLGLTGAAARIALGPLSDTLLWRDAAHIYAQRNGTNAQEKRVYGTYTNDSNHRRLSMGMSTAGVAFLRPEGAGTGASGNVLHISGLPTSNPGPGILWNDGGVVKVGT